MKFWDEALIPQKELEQTPIARAVVEEDEEIRQCYHTQGLQSIVQSWDKTCEPLLHVRAPTLSKQPIILPFIYSFVCLKGGEQVYINSSPEFKLNHFTSK